MASYQHEQRTWTYSGRLAKALVSFSLDLLAYIHYIIQN